VAKATEKLIIEQKRTSALLTAAMLLLIGVETAPAALSPLVERVQPAVVTVATYDIQRRPSGVGSGFLIDAAGQVVTSYHVLDGAYDAEVRLHDGTVLPVVSVEAEHPQSDLIRLRIVPPSGAGAWLPVAAGPPKVAESIVVVGSPLGLEKTVTEGIVSAVRTAPGLGEFFQISAPISQGSSGGPVINLDGEVLGVVTFMAVLGQNLNFAVSAAGISKMKQLPDAPTVAEWTTRRSLQEPDRAEALCREGFKFSVSGEYTQALEFYRSATEQDPTNITAWHGLGFCYSGLNRQDRAVEAYQRAIRINPDNAELRFHLANALARMQRYEEAAGAYGNAVRLDPALAEAHAGLAVALTELGRYEEAVESHRRVIRLQPEASAAYFNLGITLSRQQDWEEAASAYRQAVLLDPENIYAYQNLGVLLSRLGQDRLAAEAHKQVVRIDPDHGPAHLLLGRAYLKLGDKASALDQYKILKQKHPELAADLFEEIYP